jgi:hypothetical protein
VDISEKILSAEELEQMFTEANETEEADETAETENGAVSN